MTIEKQVMVTKTRAIRYLGELNQKTPYHLMTEEKQLLVRQVGEFIKMADKSKRAILFAQEHGFVDGKEEEAYAIKP